MIFAPLLILVLMKNLSRIFRLSSAVPMAISLSL